MKEKIIIRVATWILMVLVILSYHINNVDVTKLNVNNLL
jgi:hypothetical protein